jgi:hypothetical protein
LAAARQWDYARHKDQATPKGGLPVKGSRTTRRLRNAVIFAAARGAATAVGSGLVGLAFWWITHRH